MRVFTGMGVCVVLGTVNVAHSNIMSNVRSYFSEPNPYRAATDSMSPESHAVADVANVLKRRQMTQMNTSLPKVAVDDHVRDMAVGFGQAVEAASGSPGIFTQQKMHGLIDTLAAENPVFPHKLAEFVQTYGVPIVQTSGTGTSAANVARDAMIKYAATVPGMHVPMMSFFEQSADVVLGHPAATETVRRGLMPNIRAALGPADLLFAPLDKFQEAATSFGSTMASMSPFGSVAGLSPFGGGLLDTLGGVVGASSSTHSNDAVSATRAGAPSPPTPTEPHNIKMPSPYLNTGINNNVNAAAPNQGFYHPYAAGGYAHPGAQLGGPGAAPGASPYAVAQVPPHQMIRPNIPGAAPPVPGAHPGYPPQYGHGSPDAFRPIGAAPQYPGYAPPQVGGGNDINQPNVGVMPGAPRPYAPPLSSPSTIAEGSTIAADNTFAYTLSSGSSTMPSFANLFPFNKAISVTKTLTVTPPATAMGVRPREAGADTMSAETTGAAGMADSLGHGRLNLVSQIYEAGNNAQRRLSEQMSGLASSAGETIQHMAGAIGQKYGNATVNQSMAKSLVDEYLEPLGMTGTMADYLKKNFTYLQNAAADPHKPYAVQDPFQKIYQVFVNAFKKDQTQVM